MSWQPPPGPPYGAPYYLSAYEWGPYPTHRQPGCLGWAPPPGPPYGPPGYPGGPPPGGYPGGYPGWTPGGPDPHWRPPSWSWSPPSSCRGTFEWVRESHGRIPYRATPAGTDLDGGPIYVGRAWHHGDLLPAKVCPSHGGAYVSYSGKEVKEHHYEVLVSDHVAWRPARSGWTPPEAIRVGHTESGEPLYMGRTTWNGTLTPGKVHPSHNCLYLAWNGEEMKFYDYEIMVLD